MSLSHDQVGREPAADSDRDRRVAELAERIRRRRARGLSAGPTFSDEVLERLRQLLPRAPHPTTTR